MFGDNYLFPLATIGITGFKFAGFSPLSTWGDLSPVKIAGRFQSRSRRQANEKALADFDKAIEDQPNRIGFRLHRIHVLFYMERYSDAYEDVIQVLKRDPQNTKALHFKSRIEKHIGGLGL